ncbi:MAG: hypothetical protein IJD60_05400 [Clostridia bacterium]|nr:hypothetical protein [Clostridia bacterium]
MAGAKGARSVRGKYSAAGYDGKREEQMYISDVPAGSAQDKLYDLNKKGYRTERPWNDESILEMEANSGAAAVEHKRRVEKKTFVDKMMMQAVKEKKDAIACAVFLVIIFVMTAARGQLLMTGLHINKDIGRFNQMTEELAGVNEKLEMRLKAAQNDSNITNMAQNQLKMLRPESSRKETIYIQVPDQAHESSLQHSEEPRMEALDILLGLLDVFHIGE